MTKKDLTEKLAGQMDDLTQKDAELIINAVFDLMSDALADGEKVEIRGFGSFTVKERKAREARNPRTGETLMIEARKVPAFKPGKELKEKVSG